MVKNQMKTLHQNSREQLKLVTSKMWSNNNVGLHTFVSGAKSNQKLHQNSREQNLSLKKNVGNKNVQSFVNLKRNSNMS
jgi:hypothetical protein